MPSLILASASPQRKALLSGLGMTFAAIISTVDESAHPEFSPVKRALALARLKSIDVVSRSKDSFVIGCDTLVVAPDGTLLEKPNDALEARSMLRRQSHGTSIVHSGLCVIAPNGQAYDGVSSSAVTFKKLSDADIDWWIETRLWEGRSGAFQIDGPGQFMIERMEGDFTGVVGLPVFLLGELLQKAGYDWRSAH